MAGFGLALLFLAAAGVLVEAARANLGGLSALAAASDSDREVLVSFLGGFVVAELRVLNGFLATTTGSLAGTTPAVFLALGFAAVVACRKGCRNMAKPLSLRRHLAQLPKACDLRPNRDMVFGLCPESRVQESVVMGGSQDQVG